MKTRTLLLIATNVFILNLGIAVVCLKKPEPVAPYTPPPPPAAVQFSQLPIKKQAPVRTEISVEHPDFLSYDRTVEQLRQWHKEASDITELKSYGKSTRGKQLYYLRIFNKGEQTPETKPRVLLTACIHGNEPLASSTLMWCVGTMLKDYGKNPQITSLLDSRDIFVVPVVSPDSYPNSRFVDGVDPNRDFPSFQQPQHKSIKPIAALQHLFDSIKPNAVLSGHTSGRVIAFPWGDRMENCPDFDAYKTVVGKMCKLSGYRPIRLCDIYGAHTVSLEIRQAKRPLKVMIPIHGGEADWYYRGGAFSVVMEFGTHQDIPSRGDTSTEFNKTYKAILHFVEVGPVTEVHPD